MVGWRACVSTTSLLLTCACADIIGIRGLAYERDDPGGAGPGGTGGLGGGGAGGDGGGGAGPCPNMLLLADDFEDGTIDAVWDATMGGSGTVLETGGQLVLGATAVGAFAFVHSSAVLDAAGGTISVEIVQGTSGADAPLAHMGLGNLVVEQQGNELRFIRTGFSPTTLWMGAFDPIAHRFIRLRDDGTDTHFESAGDGVAWSAITSTATGDPSTFDNAVAQLELVTTATAFGEVRFDQLLVCR